MQTGMGVSERVRVLGAAAALVLFSALSACGGGDGREDNPPLEVSVSVDGVTDADTLTPGESAAISVPSGATLVFSSEGQTRWAPVATESSFQVNSFSFTSKSLTVTSNGGGSLVVLFKDKADETKTATLTVTVAPKEFERAARADGEVETWSTVSVDVEGNTYHGGGLYRTVLTDNGAYEVHVGNSETGLYSQRQRYDAQDRYLGFAALGADVNCTYDQPVVQVGYPMHVGKTWSGEAHRDCGDMTYLSFDQSYVRTVEAFERISVPEGSHEALRIRAEVTYTNIGGDPNDGYTSTNTCWWAVDLGRNIKCEYVSHYTDGKTSSQTTTLAKRTP